MYEFQVFERYEGWLTAFQADNLAAVRAKRADYESSFTDFDEETRIIKVIE